MRGDLGPGPDRRQYRPRNLDRAAAERRMRQVDNGRKALTR